MAVMLVVAALSLLIATMMAIRATVLDNIDPTSAKARKKATWCELVVDYTVYGRYGDVTPQPLAVFSLILQKSLLNKRKLGQTH